MAIKSVNGLPLFKLPRWCSLWLDMLLFLGQHGVAQTGRSLCREPGSLRLIPGNCALQFHLSLSDLWGSIFGFACITSFCFLTLYSGRSHAPLSLLIPIKVYSLILLPTLKQWFSNYDAKSTHVRIPTTACRNCRFWARSRLTKGNSLKLRHRESAFLRNNTVVAFAR